MHFPAAPSGCFYAFEFAEMKLRLRVSFLFFLFFFLFDSSLSAWSWKTPRRFFPGIPAAASARREGRAGAGKGLARSPAGSELPSRLPPGPSVAPHRGQRGTGAQVPRGPSGLCRPQPRSRPRPRRSRSRPAAHFAAAGNFSPRPLRPGRLQPAGPGPSEVPGRSPGAEGDRRGARSPRGERAPPCGRLRCGAAPPEGRGDPGRAPLGSGRAGSGRVPSAPLPPRGAEEEQ